MQSVSARKRGGICELKKVSESTDAVSKYVANLAKGAVGVSVRTMAHAHALCDIAAAS